MIAKILRVGTLLDEIPVRQFLGLGDVLGPERCHGGAPRFLGLLSRLLPRLVLRLGTAGLFFRGFASDLRAAGGLFLLTPSFYFLGVAPRPVPPAPPRPREGVTER